MIADRLADALEYALRLARAGDSPSVATMTRWSALLREQATARMSSGKDRATARKIVDDNSDGDHSVRELEIAIAEALTTARAEGSNTELRAAAERATNAVAIDRWNVIDDGARLVAMSLVWRARQGSDLRHEPQRFWGDDDTLMGAFIREARTEGRAEGVQPVGVEGEKGDERAMLTEWRVDADDRTLYYRYTIGKEDDGSHVLYADDDGDWWIYPNTDLYMTIASGRAASLFYAQLAADSHSERKRLYRLPGEA